LTLVGKRTSASDASACRAAHASAASFLALMAGEMLVPFVDDRSAHVRGVAVVSYCVDAVDGLIAIAPATPGRAARVAGVDRPILLDLGHGRVAGPYCLGAGSDARGENAVTLESCRRLDWRADGASTAMMFVEGRTLALRGLRITTSRAAEVAP
ncbi:MAG: hypothetical protein ACYDCK_15215, partial [Thermoplasmatota archaeon]